MNWEHVAEAMTTLDRYGLDPRRYQRWIADAAGYGWGPPALYAQAREWIMAQQRKA